MLESAHLKFFMPMLMSSRIQLAHAIRCLSMDAVQKANSGHPGMPMGMADIAEVLWNDFLSHNPSNPHWPNRDRFVLSNGHGSMLLYSLLHLSGYDVSIEDIKQFRQLGSRTPGHPEYGYTPGVETTTGPLGQGIANAVGMALAEKIMAAQFNRDGYEIIDHYTYAFMGDGCLMEGVSHEACSLAGTHKLGKLIAFWDDNGISIDGDVEGWFTDNTPERFRAYGWHVVEGVDGHDAQAIHAAVAAAQQQTDKPSLICCKTVIGFGAPNKAGKASSHGAPLGEAEIAAVKQFYGCEYPAFEIPQEIYTAWDAHESGAQREAHWQAKYEAYQAAYPELAAELIRRLTGDLPDSWQQFKQDWLQALNDEAPTVASRKASQMALEHLGAYMPELIGGSADLTGSNLTKWSGSVPVTPEDASGNYLFYGVREFGMSAIANGIALYGGLIPYVATFLVFSDYARNALRMAALMKQRNIFVFTHDSIGLGEDGQTHQPVEHVASLRVMPNMGVWRPCDAIESAVAWQAAVERHDGPSSLILSRQGLPHCQRSAQQIDAIARGGYVLKGVDHPQAVIVATGSEVGLALGAQAQLAQQGITVCVVSMPSLEVFRQQDADYRDSVFPAKLPVVAVEAGVADSWLEFTGSRDAVVSLDRFGESAPANALFEHFGFTVEHVAKTVTAQLKQGVKK